MTDLELIRNLTSGDTNAYKQMYTQYYLMVEYLIIKNSGTKEDAKDIFQDAIIVVLEKSKAPGFKLTASLKTYIYSVARNIWFTKMRKGDRNYRFNDFEDYKDAEVDDIATKKLEEKQYTLIENSIDQMGDPCKTILINFYYFKNSMIEIAKSLGYESADHAKSQKYKCMKRLKAIINEG